MDELKFAFGTTVGGECKILIFSCSVSGFIHFNLWVSNWDLFVCFIFLFFVVGCFVDVMKMEGSPESVLYVLSRTVDILNWKKNYERKDCGYPVYFVSYVSRNPRFLIT
jgi:hypothetical protein